MGKVFDLIEEGLKDAIAYEQGKINLRSKAIHIPPPPKKYKAKDVKKLRNKLHFSQNLFAVYMNVSIKTVQAWECGIRHPTSSALRLLEILDSGSTNKVFKSLQL